MCWTQATSVDKKSHIMEKCPLYFIFHTQLFSRWLLRWPSVDWRKFPFLCGLSNHHYFSIWNLSTFHTYTSWVRRCAYISKKWFILFVIISAHSCKWLECKYPQKQVMLWAFTGKGCTCSATGINDILYSYVVSWCLISNFVGFKS